MPPQLRMIALVDTLRYFHLGCNIGVVSARKVIKIDDQRSPSGALAGNDLSADLRCSSHRCRRGLPDGLRAARLDQFHRALRASRHHAMESRHRIELCPDAFVWPAD